IEPAEYEEMRWLAEEDTKRSMKRMPDDYWLAKLRQSNPGISDEEAAQVVDFMRRQQALDPFALLQPPEEGRTGQLLMMRAVNLEIALLIAQITGAVIVTDVSAMWRQLHAHTRAAAAGGDASSDLAPLHFTASLHPELAVEVSELTEAAAVQSAVGDLKSTIDRRSDREEIVRALDALQTRLGALSVPTEAIDADLPRAQLSLTPSIPESGFESPTAQRLVVSFGSEDTPAYVGLALFRRTESGDSARHDRRDADPSTSDA
ncbi:MAG: hypothetical protein ACRETY_13425, partial [Steroidobacteraceae bacterium]